MAPASTRGRLHRKVQTVFLIRNKMRLYKVLIALYSPQISIWKNLAKKSMLLIYDITSRMVSNLPGKM